MSLTLSDNIDKVFGIGVNLAKKLEKVGIKKVSDLFCYYPRRYEDYTDNTEISQIPSKVRNLEPFSISGVVLGMGNKRTKKRAFTVTEGVVADKTGSIKVVWFNQPYLAKVLKAGSSISLYGKAKYDFFNKGYVLESPTIIKKREIASIYPETLGIRSTYLRKLISNNKELIKEFRDFLPEEILADFELIPFCEAISNIHLPKDFESLKKAQKRLAFNELFLISLKAKLVKEEVELQRAPMMKFKAENLKSLILTLPYSLTVDQKKSLWAIIQDLEKNSPMNRLLNGDVGSGKTIVAALASYVAADNNFKVLFMCPTEILAFQHFETFKQVFKDRDISISLITSSRTEANIKNTKDCQIFIGTHALIQGKIDFEDVGLVIVDEQHRFGVKQRAALSKLTEKEDGERPHFLSMTATPIPRTLHLALFGDLDISVIKEKPVGRKVIVTKVVSEGERRKTYDFIRSQIKDGRQVFVVCPLIEEKGEESDKTLFAETERKSVKQEFEKLKVIFEGLKIEMLHGKMKPKEKEAVMTNFSKGNIDILVSTSVIEVGVDVPNATIMVIEDAERYGLAQIHQFRGRVGRGEHQSFCYLFSNSKTPKSLQRLSSLEEISDGFRLAEIDLEMRGPGAVFGTEQSGLLDLKMASFSDGELINTASKLASKVIANKAKYSEAIDYYCDIYVNKHLE